MTIRAPPLFPIQNHWRSREKEIDDEFEYEVLALWRKGLDTFEIAQTLSDRWCTIETQANCERALHQALEKCRQAEQGDGEADSRTG